jgi:ADP-ribosyl-[dinitrogen reductase] hydrolase
MNSDDLNVRFAGVLLGTAVGDALGLPAEGLTAERIERRWGREWRHRFIFRWGMISDDTEHTLLVAQALLTQPEDARAFQRCLGWKLRWWFAAVPAGVGLATARACIKLWIGFPARWAGVKSGGSGPAMRSAIIGAYFADDARRRREFVIASSRLTHRGWEAETAAIAVAEAAALAIAGGTIPSTPHVFHMLQSLSIEPEWQNLVGEIERSLKAKHPVSTFARNAGMKKGISGYALNVAGAAIYSWLLHRGDFRAAMTAVLECGGDTDTVGAVLGGIAGAAGGEASVPADWLKGILEWPRSRGFMRRVAARLAEQKARKWALGPVKYFWPALIPRNLVFLVIVLIHGIRRLRRP